MGPEDTREPKLFNASITVPGNDSRQDTITIQIDDIDSSAPVMELTITYTNFIKAFINHQGLIPVKTAILFPTDRVGKTLKVDILEFPLPAGTRSTEQVNVAREIIKTATPKGWVADTDFTSQNSFFNKNGMNYARTHIRTWV